MRFPYRKAWSAAVVVLMALGSAAPRGFTHAHCFSAPGEDHPGHDHGHWHSHSSPHGHCHCRHACDGQNRPQEAGADCSFRHAHVFWLGLELVVPVEPGEQQGPSPESPGENSADLFCGRPADGLLVRGDLPPHPLALSALLNLPLERSAAACGRRAALRAMAPDRVLLCDAARLERTGVFLL